MSIESRVFSIPTGVYCSSTTAHIRELPIARREIEVDSKFRPISNFQSLIDKAKEHLSQSPTCGKESISCIGENNGAPISFTLNL